MIRMWAMWRRLQYSLGAVTLFVFLGTSIYYAFIYVSPTCLDQVQNGQEHGVDCGGTCARYCRFEISAPKVLWIEPFKIMDGQYNIVAYVENANTGIGTKSLPYVMTLEDSMGVIQERSGTTVMPPKGIYPIFEGRVMTGDREPTKASITFINEDAVVWLPADIGRDNFFLEERDFEDTDFKPRLNTKVRSSLLNESKDVEIIATIFNSSGKPLTAARTVEEYFEGRSTKQVVFTWPQPIAKTLRSCEVSTDVVLAIDLSGSMDSDGGTPPEPITSVLEAAGSFVSRMREQDQVSIVTFATGASLVSQLSDNRAAVADIVKKLTIDSVEQQGSTNPGEALKKTYDELLSARHNNEARKVVILFTDGLANAPKKNAEAYATSTAMELKKMGVELFTIGLGASVNQKFLEEIATDKRHAFIAPTVKDVDTIYHTITTALCEDGPTVIEVIAKPKTSFQ